jgi:hypothetical protein
MIGVSAPAWGLIAVLALLLVGSGSLRAFITRGWLTWNSQCAVRVRRSVEMHTRRERMRVARGCATGG